MKLLTVILGTSVLIGCGGSTSSKPPAGNQAATGVEAPKQPGGAGAARQIKKSEMSPAEQKYGIAPIPNASVTYQPDVIVVGGGAESIRSQDPNGFIWTIDGSAAHAGELVPGKVLFLTNRAVGRVLDVRKEGGDLVVVLGPVELTEIVSEADLEVADLPLDFGEALIYTAPDAPGQAVSLSQASDVPATAIPAAFGTPEPTRVRDLANFSTVPVASSSGVGLRATTNAGGLTMSTEVLMRLGAPKLEVVIKIHGGAITQATIELKGAAGLKWNFDASTDVGLAANVNGLLTPNSDFSIPIGLNGAFPFALTVRQRLLVKTGFSARNTSIGATGDYVFKGGFSVGYVNKTWGIAGPLDFRQTTKLAQTGRGISLGANGISLGHSFKIIAGVGAYGFVAGPYFTFSSAVGLARLEDIGMVECMRAPLEIKLTGGVGYLIPQSVTSAINFILRKLNINYQIKGDGGFESDPMTLHSSESFKGGCRAPKTTS